MTARPAARYVILHDAVPPANLQAVIDDVWGFLEMDPEDSGTWYKQQAVAEGQRLPHGAGGMVEIYQSQSLWDNRQVRKTL